MATKNTKKRPARRKTTTRKRTVVRKSTTRRPARSRKASYRLAAWFAGSLAGLAESRRATVRSRKDAAILRTTHAGCPTCKGAGMIVVRKKDGSFAGSKSCPAKPTTTKVSRAAVARAARFGPDKRSGLIGWTCPCRAKEKPRYRDAKTATRALRAHERKKHGGVSVGGTWYAQMPENAKVATETAPKKATAPRKPTTAGKTKATARNPHSGLTDEQWLTQGADRGLLDGECLKCQGTTFYPALNPDATDDYDRQVFRRCTECTAGKVKAS